MHKDREILTALLGRHAENTGSPTARRLLKRPEDIVSKFRKVVPKGFLEARKLAEEDGKE